MKKNNYILPSLIMIKNDLLSFHKKNDIYDKSDLDNLKEYEKNHNIYLEILDDDNNSNIIEKIFLKIREIKLNKNEVYFIKQYMDEIKLHCEINFNENKLIKNDKDFILAIYSITIVLSLSNPVKVDEKNEFKTNIKPKTVEDVMNFASKILSYFYLWYTKIKIGKKSSIEYNFVTSRLIIHKFLTKISDEDGISLKNYNSSENKTIKILEIKNIKYKLHIEISYIGFKYLRIENKIYAFTNHFISIKEMLKENTHSNELFEFNDMDLFDELKTIFVFIDKRQLFNIFTEFLTENDIKSEYIEQKIEEYKKELSNQISLKDSETISYTSKRISLYQRALSMKIIIDTVEENKKIFFFFLFDFRARHYYISSISPTFFPEYRYCIHLGEEKFNNLHHEYLDKINLILDEYCILLTNLKNIDISTLSKQTLHSIIWILISIAETKKTNIGREIHISSFINEGIEIFNNFNKKEFEYKDRIKIMYYISTIIEINNKIFLKRIVSKDATASVYQHLIKYLGYANQEAIKHCNMLSNHTWFDTYSVIIDFFKKTIKAKILNENQINFIFDRKKLKKTIMTVNYGASFQTTKKYFLDLFDFDNYTKDEQDEILQIFKNFYIYLNENTSLFNIKPIELQIFLSNKSDKKIFFPDGNFSYAYYRHKTKVYDYIQDNKRHTKKYAVLTSELDNKKISRASRANFIQASDAYLVRWAEKKYKCIAIHDCFLIPYADVSYFICLINEGMNIDFEKPLNNFKKEIIFFSIFIIL